ncbi:MAG: glycosyltransferase family 9 protein [Simkaniaceae bacterium]|nr:glycosyltransferase family 9 protein [Simkaniaceae bacterium]
MKKLLLSNLAHIGDVIIATSVLPSLREKFPKTEIGFLCGSWAKDLLDVDHIHVLDHYKHDRKHPSLFRYLAQKRGIVEEISDYDAAIDLYPFFWNAAHVFYKAKIPIRVGFTERVFGKCYTHRHPFCPQERLLCESYRPLLAEFGVEGPLKSDVLFEEMEQYRNLTLLHVGGGAVRKRWQLERWIAVAKELEKQGHILGFTGREEQKLIAPILEHLERPVNLCDRLTLRQFAGVVRQSRLVIGMDSAIIHLARAFDVPSISIHAPIDNPKIWGGNIALYQSATSNDVINSLHLL